MNSYKIKINSSEESMKVQKHAFDLGYFWDTGTCISFTSKPCLFFNGYNSIIDCNNNLVYFDLYPFEEISVKDFLKLPIGSCHCHCYVQSYVTCRDCQYNDRRIQKESYTPKVYCGKCKHFHKDYLGDPTRTFCLHPTNKKIISTWLEESEVYKMLPEFLNKNNDCKNYEETIR